MPKKKENLSLEEKIQKAIILKEEEPYKIPNNWIWTRLGDITEKNQYGYTSKSEKSGKIKYLRITDIQDNKVNWKTVPFCSIDEKDLEKFKLKENDIVVTRTGATTGKSFLIESIDCEAVFASYLIRVRALSGLPKFLWNYMKTNLYWKQITEFSSGIAQPGVNAQKLENLLLPLPPLEEQKRIVEKLDSLFEKTQKIKDILEEVKEKMISKREAILSKAFTGELTEKWRSKNETSNTEELLYKINDEKIKLWEEECKKAEEEGRKKPKKPQIKDISEMLVKEDEVPYKIPENWVWIRLDNISEKISKGTTPKGGESAYVKNGIKFLRVENITKNYKLDLDKIKYISNETHVSFLKRSILEENDLLISIAGSLGRTTVISKDNLPLNTNQAIAFIRFLVKDKSFSKFFSYFFNTPIIKTLLLEQAKVTAIPNLTLEILSKTKILLPPLEEQKEIVRILDKVFEEEDKIDELLKLEESIAALESSILDKAFKGELGTQNKDDYPILERLKEIL